MKTLTLDAPCGTLTGRLTRNGNSNHVVVFNIPYATSAPFGAPVAVENLSHEGIHRQPTISEQVLTITAPLDTDADALANCPILLWIHGGAYEHGHPSEPWCDASHFAKAGIVTVALGYRKRFEGFWQDRAQPPHHPAPARALDDLVAALDWVHRNAAVFGGDTENITVSGQSAGAALALALASDPRTANRVHRVIAMSPAFSVYHGSAFRRRIVAHALGVGKGVGKDASVRHMAHACPERRELAWRRLKKFLPIDPAVGLTADSFVPTVPTIVTTTSEEFFFVPILQKLDRLPIKRLLGRALARTFRGTGPFPSRNTPGYRSRPCASAVSDSTIRSNAVTVAELCRMKGISVWTAQFCPGPGCGTGPDGQTTQGAPHCVELPRFFGREADHSFHEVAVEFIQSGTTRLAPYDNSRLCTEFYGAGADATESISHDVWAAPRRLFGLRSRAL